jgi:hypothetical protein
MATLQPSVANLRAIASPMPVPPPVMTAFFPVSSKIIPLNLCMQKYTHIFWRKATLDQLRNIIARVTHSAIGTFRGR